MSAADSRVWCGVDVGTTNVKVLLVGADGDVLARAARPTPRVADALGPCTDADGLVDLIEDLVVEACRHAGAPMPLAALCVGGVGEDGVPLDAALRPLDLSIPWNDRRASGQALRLAGSPPWQAARLPAPIEATRTAAKWAWLRDERPDLAGRTVVWVALTDYPAVRWTGRAFMSRTLAARTACYDPVARHWLPELLQACGAPPLPPVLAGGEIVGVVRSDRLRGAGLISERTAVVAGGHDHPMGASLVCGGVEGAILDSLGTAELVYVETGGVESNQSEAAHPAFSRSASILDARVAWLGVLELSQVLEPMQRHGHPLRELFATVMQGGAVPARPGAGGLRFTPDDAAATFRPEALAADRLRAVLEGVTLRGRRLVEQADGLARRRQPSPVYVAGGWARSDSLLQLRADVIGRTLRRLEEPQLPALGSAHLAARGTGARLPLDLAVRVFEPDPGSRRVYDAMSAALQSV